VERAEQAGAELPFGNAVASALAALDAVEPEREVAAPFGQLSNREREVLALVARGLTDRQIADRLVIGVRTVNTHVSTMLRKLGVTRRSDAAAWALDRGLG
jgi:non-specific serine/threonine protein kinase